MNQGEALEKELTSGFIQAVNRVPGIHVAKEYVPQGSDRGIDRLAQFWTVKDRPAANLAIQIKKSLFPRDLPQIIWTMRKNLPDDKQKPWVIILLADTISEGAKRWMQDEGIGYYESSGSLFLPTADAYILIDKPATKKQTKTVGSVFDGRRAMVLEALWEFRGAPVGVKEIAERIDAASSTVSETLSDLERRGWVETEGAGPAKVRQLIEWEAVLDAWSSHEIAKGHVSMERCFVPKMRPESMAEAIAKLCDKQDFAYEITGEWAGNQYTPHLTAVSHLKVRIGESDGKLITNLLGARPVIEGWNLGLITPVPGQEMRFIDNAIGVALASPLRTYLDLLRSAGRAKELAKEIRLHRLKMK